MALRSATLSVGPPRVRRLAVSSAARLHRNQRPGQRSGQPRQRASASSLGRSRSPPSLSSRPTVRRRTPGNWDLGRYTSARTRWCARGSRAVRPQSRIFHRTALLICTIDRPGRTAHSRSECGLLGLRLVHFDLKAPVSTPEPDNVGIGHRVHVLHSVHAARVLAALARRVGDGCEVEK